MSFQEKAQHQISQLDKELSKYHLLNNFETQTSVPKVYLVLGIGALYFLSIFFNIAGEFLTNLAGFIIPGYYSLEALFTVGKADDTHYWVTFGFFTVIESAVNAVYWFPFYYTFKFVLTLWMALPQTSGANIVYNSLLQPLFARFFQGGSASANLRAQAESFKSQ
ncbi:hypothetical protein AAFC00_003473 [Neodothiora populina]|uniref:Protein YOP1 n=1 Tax=Neodothiora populina TaxID=2781224 RepID=A0ABR3PEA0_9PEZI